MKLKEHFTEALSPYEQEQRITALLWEEITIAYTSPGRYYHNLAHLEHMLEQLIPIKDKIQHWNIMVLALCYHDIVYEPLQNNNEAESAALAEKRLGRLAMHKNRIAETAAMIMATQKHEISPVADINLFTDADLSILGAAPDVYTRYATDIRKEYAVVPDLLYVPGRKKVLHHFLDMPFIFKTAFFREQYEAKARHNLRKELENDLV